VGAGVGITAASAGEDGVTAFLHDENAAKNTNTGKTKIIIFFIDFPLFFNYIHLRNKYLWQVLNHTCKKSG
jgi:hypothetical protein